MEIFLEIPILPKTVNSMGKSSIWHSVNERKKWRKIILDRFLFYVQSVDYKERIITFGWPNLKKAKLTLTRHSSQALDPDNLPASFKYVIDALKFNKIIEDDSADHIELTCLWEKAKKGAGKITIKIESQ